MYNKLAPKSINENSYHLGLSNSLSYTGCLIIPLETETYLFTLGIHISREGLLRESILISMAIREVASREVLSVLGVVQGEFPIRKQRAHNVRFGRDQREEEQG